MDIRNVSKKPSYLKRLHAEKQALQTALSKQGHRPPFQSSPSAESFETMSLNGTAGLRTRLSFVPLPYPPCTKPLGELRQILIDDLSLETHHRGTYIIVRVIDSRDKIVVVEDTGDEHVVFLRFFNQDGKLYVDGCMAKGTIILIKEPYLKFAAYENPCIQVDHVSDVVFLQEHDSLVPQVWRKTEDIPADVWNTKGNDALDKADYRSAIWMYSKALSASPTDKEKIPFTLNRCLAYLKSEQFDAGLREAEEACAGPSPLTLAILRKAQALYYLRWFKESCDTYVLVRKTYPKDTQAHDEFSQALQRLKEQEGKYDFKDMQQEAKKRILPCLDRATYVGPVAVKASKCCAGRGLFTTEAVKAGDLLLCEKAFAYGFDDVKEGKALELNINTNTDTMTVGKQTELTGLIVQKLYKNPSFLSTITDLHHGSYDPIAVTEVDGKPVIDTFLIETIMSLNCFGSPLSTRQSHIRFLRGPFAGTSRKYRTCGVWPLASYINHSCASNARRSFIGDMLILRATRDLPANTELTFWYKAPFEDDAHNNTENKPVDLEHWGFTCKCVMCKDRSETKKSDLEKRARLSKELSRIFKAKKRPDPTTVEDLIPALIKTYSQQRSEVPRLSLFDAYLTLAGLYAVRRYPAMVIKSGLKALKALGYVILGGGIPRARRKPLEIVKWGLMTDTLVGCWMTLCIAYRDIGATELEAQAEEFAKITYRICVGEDETFAETYWKGSQRTDGLLAEAK